MWAVWSALLCLGSCGGSGDDGFGTGTGGGRDPDFLTIDTLQIVSHSPAGDAVQVALDATIQIDFDNVIAQECLQDQDTWLAPESGGGPVPVSYQVVNGGRSVRFLPAAPLRAETSYVFQLSAFTCDLDGRLLEEDYRIGFRSFDETPPAVASSSVAQNATGVERTGVFQVVFDEAVDPASLRPETVYLRDVYGTSYPCGLSADGGLVQVDPLADLPGSRSCVLVAVGVEDRAGNRMPRSWSVSFTTAADLTPPQIVGTWPAGHEAASPRVHPAITFDESMDIYSVETAAVRLFDEHANVVPFKVEATPDQRTFRLVPPGNLAVDREYIVMIVGGPGAVTDLSGNTLHATSTFTFRVGDDAVPPALLGVEPRLTGGVVPLNVKPRLSFDETLDRPRITADTVVLEGPTGPVAFDLAVDPSERAFTVTPDRVLTPGASYTLTLRGGQDGLRDVAGNPFARDELLTFKVHTDTTPPKILVWPVDGSVSVPTDVHVAAAAEQPLDPSSVTAETFVVTTEYGAPVPGRLSLQRGDRVIRFWPDVPWTWDAGYQVVLRGGEHGIRERNGSFLGADQDSSFRVGHVPDVRPPTVSVTFNWIDEARREQRTLPPFGFEIDVRALDAGEFSLDMSSAEVVLSGTGQAPGSETIFVGARLDGSTLRYRVPASARLTPGSYTLSARVADLSGNVGTSASIDFRVEDADAGALPFERTQVVWTRFDLDRDGNGRGDLEDDLYRLGLATLGDPAGTNRRMIEIVRDGILARCHLLFARKQNGGRLGADSVPIRFTHRQPLGVAHMQIACGGFDPEGRRGRDYGAESTGTLGRAYFDYRNGQTNDLTTGTSPGLGVFPAELFLFESRVHIQVYPSFLTTFARRFLNLAPAMGGTPAGQHPLDAKVLAAGFDYATAPSAEQARYNTVFAAADDWTTAIGTILAHEVGHAVGLVAQGRESVGLHGDASLHNEFSSITDVMAASVGYETLVGLGYEFRDLNIAYLRQRVLLR